jgi:hypothetical protein
MPVLPNSAVVAMLGDVLWVFSKDSEGGKCWERSVRQRSIRRLGLGRFSTNYSERVGSGPSGPFAAVNSAKVHSAKVHSAFDLGRYFVIQTITHHGRLINKSLLQNGMLSS